MRQEHCVIYDVKYIAIDIELPYHGEGLPLTYEPLTLVLTPVSVTVTVGACVTRRY